MKSIYCRTTARRTITRGSRRYKKNINKNKAPGYDTITAERLKHGVYGNELTQTVRTNLP